MTMGPEDVLNTYKERLSRAVAVISALEEKMIEIQDAQAKLIDELQADKIELRHCRNERDHMRRELTALHRDVTEKSRAMCVDLALALRLEPQDEHLPFTSLLDKVEALVRQVHGDKRLPRTWTEQMSKSFSAPKAPGGKKDG